MKQIIRNASLTATVNHCGAELCSLQGAGGMEYMWQANPDIWGRHAPVLFPIVGSLADNRYCHAGETYELGQHGFARDMDFNLVDATETSLVYSLQPTPATRKQYPFEFGLTIEYRLEGHRLEIGYRVKNNGGGDMPFSIGAHPAFALNWQDDDRIENYYLEFETSETVDTHLLDSNHLLSQETQNVLNNESVLPLHREMFNRDALIFLDLKSERVSLCSTRCNNRLTV
jgi:galactose mutarotase-like enzyme